MTPTPLDAIVGAQIAIPKASKSPTLSHFKGTWPAFGDRLLPAADPPSISRDIMIQQHFPPFRLDQATRCALQKRLAIVLWPIAGSCH
ncbi:hypothetical protein ABKN59_009830 [Abortiporus biennis]